MTNVDENLVLLRTRALAVFVAVLLAFTFLVGIGAASAAPYTGGLTPTIYGSRADLNSDGIVNGADDSNAFYGDTSIIDGMLDCDTWGVTANAGTAGDGVIDGYDDCTLIGYDGSLEGDVILVVDGAFATANTVDIPDGTALPMTYNAADPMDPSVVDSDFGWSTIGGRVDSNGNGMIDGSDDTLGLIGSTVDEGFGDPTDGADILASSICLFGCLHHPSAHGIIIAPALDGLVDLNSDGTITAADTCTGCFFGRDLVSGFVTTPDGGGGGGGGTPSPTPPPVVVHARTAPLTLTRHLIAEGTVHVADGTLECAANVTVLIQRWVHGHWRTVKTTVTDANGAFRVHLPDHVGKYRVKVPRVTLPSGDVCAGATSPSVWNHH